jgi:hypothetical protein
MADVAGSDLNVLIGAYSFFGQAVTFQLGQRLNALVPAGADGDDLTRLGHDRYALTQVGAKAAFTFLAIQRSAGGPIGVVSAGTLVHADGGIRYVLLQDAVFAAGTLKVENLIARAEKAGTEAQVGANKLRFWVDQSALFDPTLRVNNPSTAFEPGEDPEPGDSFRERIHDFWDTVQRGTLGAIELGSRVVPGITRALAEDAMAIDTVTGRLKPARVVLLYAANEAGVTPTSSTAAIYESLEEWRACGVATIIRPGTPQLVNIKLRLKFAAGIKVDVLSTQIVARIIAMVNGLNPGTPLLLSYLRNILAQYRTQGLTANESTVLEPAGDLIPDDGKSIRVTLNTVTVEIV